MARAKVKRKSTAIDMTAMCDVAFLLLTFFILSAKPKTEKPIAVDQPASTAIIPIPESNFAVITVGHGKVFYTIEGDDLRKETIKAMMDTYHVPFTPTEINTFAHTEFVGSALNILPQVLSMTADQKKNYHEIGMQVDTTEKNELFYWVYQTRKAGVALYNKEPGIAIYGDAKEEYPTIAMIIKTLQKQKVNKFSLITSLKKK